MDFTTQDFDFLDVIVIQMNFIKSLHGNVNICYDHNGNNNNNNNSFILYNYSII